ncbi:rod shape-determining protein MreC [Rhodoferax sp. PAMC 29310]|uniref:rod shape-determining protein MreC n=1 Tax=Rhodoferax sp. PAMC 29310 TaxID=2822760 RepID=UPI001B32E3FA|nr:rod shape-determining protein MreC [Rhodoferax sp. PAMC 29310]
MPLGTLDGAPPPFFRQGPSALSKLTFFSALALFLMVADTRLQIAQPLRVAVATVLYPVQWTVMQPVIWAQTGGQYFESLKLAQANEETAQRQLTLQSQRANQAEQLALENARLRQLLGLRDRLTTPAQTAQVLYDAADPYSHKVIVDRGSVDGTLPGSPVLDEHGILGQVTRVYPMISEVTLIIDRDQAIPVLNTRTGARGLVFGDPSARANSLELRFMAASADVQEGDQLTTSGVDGVYPAGLPVARVEKVERRADTAFARITCAPLALVTGVRHVMILTPVGTQIAPRPQSPAAGPTSLRGLRS